MNINAINQEISCVESPLLSEPVPFLFWEEVRWGGLWEAYVLYNNLLGKSPYLSDDVLIKAIKNETGLP